MSKAVKINPVGIHYRVTSSLNVVSRFLTRWTFQVNMFHNELVSTLVDVSMLGKIGWSKNCLLKIKGFARFCQFWQAKVRITLL